MPRPESSDLATQKHQPTCGVPVASRNDGTVAEPQVLQGASVQLPPGLGSFRPDGSVGSGGQGAAPAVW